MTVHLFARARDLAAADTLQIDMPVGATVGTLRSLLAVQHPALAGLLARSALAVDDEFADDNTVLPVGAAVALLPPVSGGRS